MLNELDVRSCGHVIYPPGAPHSNCDAEENTRILMKELRRIAQLPGGVLYKEGAS